MLKTRQVSHQREMIKKQQGGTGQGSLPGTGDAFIAGNL